MPSPEHGLQHQPLLDRFAGNIFAGAAEVYLQHIRYIGRENIDQTDEILKSGSSVLLVSNHPKTLPTMWASNPMTLLYNRRASGIILKYAFSPENKKNLIGDIVRLILTHHHIEPLFVKTKKYFPDDEERREYNEEAKNRGNEILNSQRGVLFLFAEGTRTEEEKMGHAESGLTKYSALAGYVLPITTITDGEHPTVIIHPLIPGKAGVTWCEKEFGQEDGAKVFSNLIMTIIATAQPNLEKKGVYKETSQVMEDFITGKLNFDDIPEGHIKQVLSVFKAYKNNEFDPNKTDIV
jgi:hypothetical protein